MFCFSQPAEKTPVPSNNESAESTNQACAAVTEEKEAERLNAHPAAQATPVKASPVKKNFDLSIYCPFVVTNRGSPASGSAKQRLVPFEFDEKKMISKLKKLLSRTLMELAELEDDDESDAEDSKKKYTTTTEVDDRMFSVRQIDAIPEDVEKSNLTEGYLDGIDDDSDDSTGAGYTYADLFDEKHGKKRKADKEGKAKSDKEKVKCADVEDENEEHEEMFDEQDRKPKVDLCGWELPASQRNP
ncbi:hypothetical protein QR680_003120 [Steinernema hermaphroditum]|uniref:Uncharacterized protein n=1 Tax=Steinernema hermaphroditum TaxID=289476 RepID=A0AA39H818_9BILA|nr:hypothetical protein QR680_003120 [Steinernema hermaphroditum]